MINDPVRGAGYLLRGITLIGRPGLRRYVLLPLLVNFAIFGLGIWYGYQQFQVFLDWLNAMLPTWLRWLDWLLWPLFLISLAVVVFYTFSLAANLIASPFNGLLAEKVELHLTGQPLESGGGWKKVAAELVPNVYDEVKKILYSLVWAVPFLLLFLIPGPNVAAPILWMAFTAWMLAIQYMDYPMSNHGLRLREMRRRLRERRLLGLGFGAAAMVLTMVPGLNFLVMPSAVAGATALWVEQLDQGAGRKTRR